MVRKDNRMYSVKHASWVLSKTIKEMELVNIPSRQYPITFIDEMKEALQHIDKAIEKLEWDIK